MKTILTLIFISFYFLTDQASRCTTNIATGRHRLNVDFSLHLSLSHNSLSLSFSLSHFRTKTEKDVERVVCACGVCVVCERASECDHACLNFLIFIHTVTIHLPTFLPTFLLLPLSHVSAFVAVSVYPLSPHFLLPEFGSLRPAGTDRERETENVGVWYIVRLSHHLVEGGVHRLFRRQFL